MRHRFIWLGFIMIAGILGCSSVNSGAESEKLLIYSGRSESLVGAIIERFEMETGIDVQVRYASTAEIAALLLEEGENSRADLFYAQDPGGLGAIANAGMLTPLPESTLSLTSEQFHDTDGEWVGISGRARVVVYNTENVVEGDLPADLWGFTDPIWGGRLGWAPTNSSFQAMVTALRASWGDDQTEQWLAAMQANDPIAYEGNTPIVAAVGSGEVDVGLVNHYYLYRFLAEEGETFPARNYFLPDGGPGSLVMVSGAGILDGGENPANAQKFIEYLLSPAGQQYFADETYEYPVIAGMQLPSQLTPLDELLPQAIKLDLGDLADWQGTAKMLQDAGILP